MSIDATRILNIDKQPFTKGLTQYSNNGSVSINSIFADNSIKTTDKEDKTTTAQGKLMLKLTNKQAEFAEKYNCSKELKQVEKIEQSMRYSKSGALSNVPTNLKDTIKQLGKEIVETINNMLESCSKYKDEASLESYLKDCETELRKKKQEAKVYAQRAYKARELDNKLTEIQSDPKKSKLIERINLDAIADKLTGPVENLEVSEKTGNSGKSENSDEEPGLEDLDKSQQKDEISEVITSIIKYVDDGEQDKNLKGYIKDEKQPENKENPFTTNPFQSFNAKKKNPCLSDF